MSNIILSEPLASQIRQEAQAQGVEVESFLEAAVRHYRFHAQQNKINAETNWWRTQSKEVHSCYQGQFVAIHQQQVVDHDASEEALIKRIRAKYGKTPILITPSEGQRDIHIVSTRLTRP